ncbi:hypothetical protein OGL96_00100 [Lacticaseibacillus paracasei]|uniref:hypothetical protein n=1 Tax=Lacticaseibacillus paracasei TaxID=1597 RepID=UPI0021E722C5|nr:hypothetical protein [Lacticaseibacillus paracasei]UYI60210.1 hypothetical protein OGL96_00100 [Lacticaseibacillus paracasei]
MARRGKWTGCDSQTGSIPAAASKASDAAKAKSTAATSYASDATKAASSASSSADVADSAATKYPNDPTISSATDALRSLSCQIIQAIFLERNLR